MTPIKHIDMIFDPDVWSAEDAKAVVDQMNYKYRQFHFVGHFEGETFEGVVRENG